MPNTNVPSSAPRGDTPATKPRTTVAEIGAALQRGERDLQMLVGTFSGLSDDDDERKISLVDEAGNIARELQKNEKVRMPTARKLAELRMSIDSGR